MLAHQFYLLFERGHLLVVSQHAYHVVTCHDAEFWEECLEHLQVTIANPIEHYGVDIFKYKMLFYHVKSKFFCKITIKF